MTIDAEEFRQAIRDLDACLKSGIESGHTCSELANEYQKKCYELLLLSAKSDNWEEIAEDIAFFLFAGCAMQILNRKFLDLHNNHSVPAINSAAQKVESLAELSLSQSLQLRDRKANFSRTGALAKLANDPKQQAKEEVRQCWLLWKEKPLNYKSKSAFAKDMLNKFDILESQKVIEGWCRDWDKDCKK